MGKDNKPEEKYIQIIDGKYYIRPDGTAIRRVPLKDANGYKEDEISNFTPMLKKVFNVHDGYQTNTEYGYCALLRGKLRKMVRLNYDKINKNNVDGLFGEGCRSYPGGNRKEHLSDLMKAQIVDEGIDTEDIYKFIGMTEIPGRGDVFINGENGVDVNGLVSGISVNTPRGHEAFKFYRTDDNADLKKCLEASMAFENIGPATVTLPVVSYFYLAVANYYLHQVGHEANMILSLTGEPQSGKSATVKLALNHFAMLHYSDPSPMSVDNISDSALAETTSALRFVPSLLDDVKAFETTQDRERYKSKIKFLGVEIADRSPRLLCNPDGSVREARVSHSMLFLTQEHDTELSASTRSRMWNITMKAEYGIPDKAISFQKQYGLDLLNGAGQDIVQWIIQNSDNIKKDCIEALDAYRNLAVKRGVMPRVATNCSHILYGIQLRLMHLRDRECLTDEMMKERMQAAIKIILDASEEQNEEVRDEDAVMIAINRIRASLTSGKAYCLTSKELFEDKPLYNSLYKFWERRGDAKTSTARQIGDVIKVKNKVLMACDKTELFSIIESYGNFPISSTELWKRFRDRGIIEPSGEKNKQGENRPDKKVTIRKGSNGIWRICLKIEAFYEDEEGDDNEKIE